MTMLRSISEKEKEVESMIAQAHQEAEAKIQDARQRSVQIVEEARSRALEEKRLMKERALETVQEEVRRTEHEYEETLNIMAKKARARVPQAVERVIEAVLPH